MDSAKYQSDIIHDIEMRSECAMFPQKEYICMNDLMPCLNSKNTRIFQNVKEYLFWNGQGIRHTCIPYRTFWNIIKKEIGNQMMCIKEEMWKRVCEACYSVAPNVLVELYNSMPKENCRSY